jgi:pimeloyl-ACP methyl ester carboxylesterase
VLPQCRTTLLPECGHFAHVEWPAATVDALA